MIAANLGLVSPQVSLFGHVCIDGIRPNPIGPGIVFHGWWLADRPVRRLVAASATGAAMVAWHGLHRPDVSAAFPSHAHARTAGFMATVHDRRDGSAHTAPGRWWVEDEDGQWWNAPADWDVSTPVAFRCTGPVNAPPSNITEAISAGDDVEARFRLALAGSAGLSLRLDITNKCNLRCVMCHYQDDEVFRRPTRLVTPAQFETWFRQVSAVVGEVILSCADEPLISRFFPDIVRLIRRLRPDVEIKLCTNAMLMTPEISRLLVEQQVDLLIVSMDGCTPATFESIRTGGRFDRVVTHVLTLQELRRRHASRFPEIILNFVMMHRNLHEAPLFVELAARIGATAVDFRHVVASHPTFDLFHEQLSREPGRFNHYRERLLKEGRRHNIRLHLPPAYENAPTWAPAADEPGATLADFFEIAQRFRPECGTGDLRLARREPTRSGAPKLHELFADTFCPRPFSEIMLREQEEILPCPWHARPLGDLTTTPNLLEAFLGPEFRALRARMLRSEGDPHCRQCPWKLHELPSETHG